MTPDPDPLFMPTQDLLSAPMRSRARRRVPARVALARLTTFGGTLALLTWGAREMHAVVDAGGVTALEWVFLGFFAATFGWIAFPACAALAGLAFAPRRARPGPAANAGADAGRAPGRVALVMPIYNEDPAGTCAALESMALEIAAHAPDAAGAAAGGAVADPDPPVSRFEIFLLSDTTDPGTLVRETAAAVELRRRLAGRMDVFYRHRWANIGRKAGNVREFVERWGGRYEAMLVLDADSLMDAPTVLGLVAELDAHPDVALVQSVPRLAGGATPFARLQQFAGSVYGPVVARGVDAWAGDEGNFWGHNALIRTRPFAAAAGLPELPGRRPFGGSILSHDFVEAALLVRAGHRVRMLPALGGSYEDGPPSLLDAAVRDRRWAQGNVQHLGVVGARGLRWTSRAHLINGFLSYAASPLWLGLVVVGLALSLQASVVEPSYFGDGLALFPSWPTFDSERMLGLFAVSMVVLLLPKALGTLATLAERRARRAHGGGARVIASAALETLLSALLAPIMMLVHTRILWQVLRGQDSGWELQRRGGRALGWSEVWRRHWSHEALGLVALAALWALAPNVLPWLAPILLGLVLAAPLSRWSSDPEAGRRLARAGLLLVPAETEPPVALARRDALLERYRAALDGIDPAGVLADARARSAHYGCMAPPPPTPRGAPDPVRLAARAKLEETMNLDEAIAWLERRELLALLSDGELFERWHRGGRPRQVQAPRAARDA